MLRAAEGARSDARREIAVPMRRPVDANHDREHRAARRSVRV